MVSRRARRRDVSGPLVTPGLIDLHTHVYWGGTSLGIDADAFARASAVTTSVDTGSAGPGNFAGFRKHVIEPSESRILAYLHVSFAGIFAFSNTIMVGESDDMRLLAARDAAAVADANRDVDHRHQGRDRPQRERRFRHRAARRRVAGRPTRPACRIMVHIDEPPPSYEDVVARLRPGDVLTHCLPAVSQFAGRTATAR